MKTKRKFSAVLVTLVVTFVMLFAFVLALGLRVNADAEATGNGEFELTDSPSEKLDLLSGYAVRFASADSLSADSAAASEIANMISAQGSYVASLPDIASSAQAREILIGTTNRDESSAFYQELLDARDNEDDLVWGYYVVGTKVLFTANCTDAFNYGFADFVAHLEICSFKPTVGTKSVGVMTRADYDAMIEADAEAQKAKRIEELKEKIAKFSNTDFTNGEYMTPEFTKMPESDIWGTPLHYPTEGQHPRVNITPDTLKSIKNYITTTDEGKYLYEAMVEFAKREFTGELPDAYMHETGRIGWHNVDETGLAIIEARAFVYLVSGDAEYGYSAVLAMKNYLKTFDLGWIHSDQCREFGRTMFVTAEIYDWCYDLLTAKDKEQFIVACTYIASGSADTRYGGKYAGLCQSGNAYMEVGYPPSEQGSVAGHGAEAQILRDYLSISIAMFDENPTWYNYVAARLYNDFIEFRNYYFRAGMYPQGIFNYAPHRHSSDVWSAWLFYCATGENPYSDDLNRIANGFIEQMAPDGSYFGTGDGSRPASTQAYSMYIFTICAALYGDSGLRDAVLDYYGKDSLEGIKTGAQTTFSTVHHIIFGAAYFQKTGTTEAVEWNEGKDPVSYHSYPIGQMIARAEWNNPNAPAAFMLIAEKSTSNHEHADAGTFQLFYKGLYSGESGVYDKYGSDHWRYYHQSTVAHNGLLIFDPNGVDSEPVYDATGKLTNAAKVYYSGGQRHFFGAGDTLDEWLDATDTVTGTVTGHEYGLNADGSADYAYLAGDISASYLLSQASYVGRNMLTLFTGDEKYPMYFIVYDSIDTASETLVNKFLLHSPTDPDIDDTAKRVTITKDDARLVLTALKGADKIEKLGGNNDPTKWEEDDKNYLITRPASSLPPRLFPTHCSQRFWRPSAA